MNFIKITAVPEREKEECTGCCFRNEECIFFRDFLIEGGIVDCENGFIYVKNTMKSNNAK